MNKIWTRFPQNLRVSYAIDVPPPYLRSNVCIDYQVVEEHDFSVTYNQQETGCVNYTKEWLQIHKGNECVDLQARSRHKPPVSIKSVNLGGDRRPPGRRVRESGARERRSRVAGCFEQDWLWSI